jgi:hypothetical protein
LESEAVLPAAIEAAAAELGLEFCDISGFGELQWVELKTAGVERPIRFEGPLDLLQLKGRLRRAGDVTLSDYTCTVARATDNGIELLGGQLVAAGSAFVELGFAQLVAVESAGRSPALSAADEPSPAGEPASRVGDKTAGAETLADKWADALAESKRQERLAREQGLSWDSDAEEVRPSLGDIVNHRQFGQCKVVRLDDEHISLRKPDGRVVQLGLAILKFDPRGELEGKPVFDVVVSRS